MPSSVDTKKHSFLTVEYFYLVKNRKGNATELELSKTKVIFLMNIFPLGIFQDKSEMTIGIVLQLNS